MIEKVLEDSRECLQYQSIRIFSQFFYDTLPVSHRIGFLLRTIKPQRGTLSEWLAATDAGLPCIIRFRYVDFGEKKHLLSNAIQKDLARNSRDTLPIKRYQDGLTELEYARGFKAECMTSRGF